MKLFRSITTEPLCHFFILSLCIYAWLQTNQHTDEKKIVVTKEQQKHLTAAYIQQHRRIPTKKDIEHLVNAEIMDEALFQQGLIYQLDQQDPVVRRRVIQKMNFILEAQATPMSPTLDKLNDYLESNLDSFSGETLYDIDHVFFKSDQGQQSIDKANETLAILNSIETKALIIKSDPFIRGLSFNGLSISQISNTLGILDGKSLSALKSTKVHQWIGPIQSRFGLHLIRVNDVKQPPVPTLKSHRHEIYAAWKKQEKQQRLAQLKLELLDEYQVTKSTGYDQTLTQQQVHASGAVSHVATR
ncbi:MAG: peptidyl-prolyl cis-trans isomerase [Pseudomonadales bacterium]|nr:peptidyl-prolyl cis-trans isomerase [Pseudomonadales bacterium]